jgi:hypothetical protein
MRQAVTNLITGRTPLADECKMSSSIVYDKAKYHQATVMASDLDAVQTEVHTAFFLGWLLDNGLTSDDFNRDCPELIAQYKAREIDALRVYESWDCCLVDDMLSDTGNAFAQAYFDFDRGQYMADYRELLVRGLPSEFHVPYSWENYEIIRKRIDKRFQEWQRGDLAEQPQPRVRNRRRRRLKRWMLVAATAILIWALFVVAILMIPIIRGIR